jgi:KaiC/GvpD/RAD55 family RecA-like ATPase
MANDNEYRLVSKVIADRNIIPVIERGIKDDWIVDDDLRRIWKFVREHYANYREVPTAVAVVDNFPNFKVLNVEDTLEYLLDVMVAYRRRTLTRNGIERIIESVSANNHELALTEMSKTVSVVNEQGVQGTTHLDMTKETSKFLEEYYGRMNSKMLGVPTGFKDIDEATAGLQGGQLITLIAPPKTGKSQIALRMAANVHEAGLVPMFQSFEMNNHEQSQRYLAMKAHLNSTQFRLGRLDDTSMARFEQTLESLSDSPAFNFVDAVGGLTIDSLVAKAEQLNPDVIFVDGVYLMMDQVSGDSNTPQALTNITRGLKRVAQRMNIPVVITTQTLLWKMKGGKVDAGSIGYSSSFFQDSDVIIGLEPIEGEDYLRTLKVVQARNCGPRETSITWNWKTGCFHDEESSATCKFCSTSVYGVSVY